MFQPAPAETLLVFSEDLYSEGNPCDTTIRNSSDNSIMYTIATRHPRDRHAHSTIRNGDGEILASTRWGRDPGDDQLTLGNHPSMKAHKWLRKSKIPFHRSMMFVKDLKGNEYEWTIVGHDALEMHSCSNAKTPIARFKKCNFVTNYTPAQLSMNSTAMSISDIVIVSLLLFERNTLAHGNVDDGANYTGTSALARFHQRLSSSSSSTGGRKSMSDEVSSPCEPHGGFFKVEMHELVVS